MDDITTILVTIVERVKTNQQRINQLQRQLRIPIDEDTEHKINKLLEDAERYSTAQSKKKIETESKTNKPSMPVTVVKIPNSIKLPVTIKKASTLHHNSRHSIKQFLQHINIIFFADFPTFSNDLWRGG